ncbi:MAG: LCP family protein [Acetobacter sp.]|nr:LCP family protein [Bacteroides sp.]MCM1340370.1 LCP family protein [Acetobacter sp.]MCM1432983.1 LCP family protein [Clostridiales bacterium]
MRLFKNRGDIYFSKNNKKKSKEQKILIFALVFIVVFTIVFMIFLGVKNDFSVKKFFKPENLEISQEYNEKEVQLPEIAGKKNYVVMLNNEDNLLFTALIQADLDNTAYKCSILKSNTVYDGNTLADIYSKAGAENVKIAVETLFNVSFDYYIDMTSSAFAELYDEMGDVSYLVLDDIKYRNNDDKVSYSVRVKAGQQNIKGNIFINMIRYYLDTNNFSRANDLILNSMLQHNNEENYLNGEKLFTKFVTNADTNISVRTFSMADDALMVMSNEKTEIKIYSADPEYSENELTGKGIKNIKGYFVK